MAKFSKAFILLMSLTLISTSLFSQKRSHKEKRSERRAKRSAHKARRSDTADYDKSEAKVFGSFIYEDASPSYVSSGAAVEYTRFVGRSIGFTGDAGANLGSKFGTSYSQFGIMAGPSILPFKRANANDRFKFFIDILGGVTSVYASTAVAKTNTAAYSMLVGSTFSFTHREGPGISFMIHYNPFFVPGAVQNNIRFGAGINFGHTTRKG